jgi:hypothetical protein
MRRCKCPLDVNFEAVPVTEESTPEVPVMAADDRLSTLVSVMSQLADRMDAQQIELNQLQEVQATSSRGARGGIRGHTQEAHAE